MACNSITNITKGCDDFNSGGIVSVAIIDSASVTGITVSADGHTITAVSLVPTETFQVFEFNRNTGSLVNSEKIDLINTSTYFENTLNLVFARQSASKSRALTILGQGQRFLDIMVTDSNNVIWYLEDAQLITNEATSGVAKADGSKYTVSFKADMNNLPYEVPSDLYATLI